MPPTIHIEGPLTPPLLASALCMAAGERWCGEQVQLKGSTRTWDMALYTAEGIALIEYDGDLHYTDPARVRIDREKDRIAIKRGHGVIHFPYWLQLDARTLKYFFGLTASVIQDVPHGFISATVFPADFCEAGLKRFIRELQGLPRPVGDAVAYSLRDRVAEYGLRRVLPETLWHIGNVR